MIRDFEQVGVLESDAQEFSIAAEPKYKFRFETDKLKKDFSKWLRSQPSGVKRRVASIMSSLLDNPYSFNPGKKHLLYQNWEGCYACYLTGTVRLIYRISEVGELEVVAVAFSLSHYDDVEAESKKHRKRK